MKNTPKPNQAIITSRYWLVLSAIAGLVALFPLAILLMNFAANPSSNPFDETGYGAVIWAFFISVPTGGIIFAIGALVAVAIEWFVELKRKSSR
jgi:hypothetical protein